MIEELVHSRSWLNEVNAELQKSVDLAEVNITTLRSEMGFLRSQVKRWGLSWCSDWGSCPVRSCDMISITQHGVVCRRGGGADRGAGGGAGPPG